MKINTHIKTLLCFSMLGVMMTQTAFAQENMLSGDSAGFLESTTSNVNTNTTAPLENALSNDNQNLAVTTTTAAADPVLYTAAPELESALSVYNVTQKKDASTGGNKPGDVIEVTATAKALGEGTITAYAASVTAANLFKVSQVIDPINGGVVRERTTMVFPPVNLDAACNCSEPLKFQVKLNENLCTDFSSIAASGLVVTYENKTQTIPVTCTSTPAPVKPVVKTTPKAPKTGPELAVLAVLAVVGGVYFARRKTQLS